MVRNSARFLAPVALAAVAVGVYLVVHANVSTTHSRTTVHNVEKHRSSSDPRKTSRSKGPRFYTVKAGDTLSDISRRTGVSLARLDALNPSLSPNDLQTGQRLRLRQ